VQAHLMGRRGSQELCFFSRAEEKGSVNYEGASFNEALQSYRAPAQGTAPS
jgi:hypothetical protein